MHQSSFLILKPSQRPTIKTPPSDWNQKKITCASRVRAFWLLHTICDPDLRSEVLLRGQGRRRRKDSRFYYNKQTDKLLSWSALNKPIITSLPVVLRLRPRIDTGWCTPQEPNKQHGLPPTTSGVRSCLFGPGTCWLHTIMFETSTYMSVRMSVYLCICLGTCLHWCMYMSHTHTQHTHTHTYTHTHTHTYTRTLIHTHHAIIFLFTRLFNDSTKSLPTLGRNIRITRTNQLLWLRSTTLWSFALFSFVLFFCVCAHVCIRVYFSLFSFACWWEAVFPNYCVFVSCVVVGLWTRCQEFILQAPPKLAIVSITDVGPNKQIRETNTPCVPFNVFLFYYRERCEKVDHVRCHGFERLWRQAIFSPSIFCRSLSALQAPCGVASNS